MSLLDLWQMLSPDMKLAWGSTLVMLFIGYIGSKMSVQY